jgi:hypothetical protein
MQDNLLSIRGRLRIKGFHHGKLAEEFDEQNLIVYNASTLLAGWATGALFNSVPFKPINQIGFGTGNSATNVGQSHLTGAYLKNFDSVTYAVGEDNAGNPIGDAFFNFSLGTGEANGTNIWEYGLFSSGNGSFGDANFLFARRVRSSVLAKTSAWSFTGQWWVQFPIAAADLGGSPPVSAG